MRTMRLLPFIILGLAMAPLALFLLMSNAVLKNHIKTSVVNDPQASLSQSIAGFGGAYNSMTDQLLITAVRFSEKDRLKKDLEAVVPALADIKSLCQEAALAASFPLFVLTDKAGNVLYDTLNIPPPVPTALPTPAVRAKKTTKAPKSKKSKLLLVSIKDWPGMEKALAGHDMGGLFPYQGHLYRALWHPVTSKGKIIGTVLLGEMIDKAVLDSWKSNAGNDLALYSESLAFCTQSPPPPFDYARTLAPGFNHSDIHWNGQDYLVGELLLAGIGEKPAASIVIFQPIRQSTTIEGDPQKTIVHMGWLLLVASSLLAILLTGAFMLPFSRLVRAMDEIKKGNFNVTLPTNFLSEWGLLGRSLQEMIDAQKEKERISLILGKVVDPQAAKKILAEKDYFSLKGERRQCTLLQADLRGFNILSENMTPEALVEALNQYFSIINEVVFKYEGMLDKFIGDTALAVWGAPFQYEDKELRAVKTALEIQDALKDFNISRIKKGVPPFTIGVGIHTGTVVSGNLGSEKRCDYTVIGEPVHIVARLCSMATPGQTVVSDETYQKIKSLVKAGPLNPIAVKGSMESLKTFEITQML